MWAGVLYDRPSLESARELAESFKGQAALERHFDDACRSGLQATSGNKTFARWAEALHDIAKRGLSRWQPEALSLLAPIEQQIASGVSPAERQRRAFHDAASPRDYLTAIRY